MKTSFLMLGVVAAWCGACHAAVRVSAIIGEHMVLQAGTHTPIYGWANPGEAVAVSVGEAKIATTTGADGKWQVVFKDLKTRATPVTMSIAGNNTLTYQDVLIGDVWVCSGQSNMALPLRRVLGRDDNDPKGLGQANFPQMRLYRLPKDTVLDPQPDCKGSWAICKPGAAKEFSALGYFFGREIHLSENIPVGLINACRGGSSGQMWTSLEGLQSEPALANYLQEIVAAKGGGPLKRFAIAGADQKFVWGDARIDGLTVMVSSPQVPAPVAVRYAWEINPDGCNLFNAAGLPASPFRTDDWKLTFAKQ